MWYTISSIFNWSWSWAGFMLGYWCETMFLFSLVFLLDGDVEDRRSFSSSLNKRKQLMCFWHFCPQHRPLLLLPHNHFLWGRISCLFCVWDLLETLSKTSLIITTQGSWDSASETARSMREGPTSVFIYSINIWAPTMCHAYFLTLGTHTARSLSLWADTQVNKDEHKHKTNSGKSYEEMTHDRVMW